jgi:hypothetical protein
MNRHSELAQAPHVVPDQSLPFAFVGPGPIRFLPRLACAERPMNHYRQRVDHGDECWLVCGPFLHTVSGSALLNNNLSSLPLPMRIPPKPCAPIGCHAVSRCFGSYPR